MDYKSYVDGTLSTVNNNRKSKFPCICHFSFFISICDEPVLSYCVFELVNGTFDYILVFISLFFGETALWKVNSEEQQFLFASHI